jgi:predicted DsbA family dithiol-disulfide isomerase
MRINFVSDVACPWCAIGLNALERALERIGTDIGAVELHTRPFELNPTMPPEGADAA